jgi:hypothetical protein
VNTSVVGDPGGGGCERRSCRPGLVVLYSPFWMARLLHACLCNPEDAEVQRCSCRKDDPEPSLEDSVRCGVVHGVTLRFRRHRIIT